MTLRQIFILIISALLLFFGYQYYKNDFCPICCTESGVGIGASSVLGAAAGPLVFNWNSANPITKDKFEALKAEIFSTKKEGDSLEITGYYFADEENDTEYDDLGFARAVAIGELLKKDNPDLNVITKSDMVDMIPGADSDVFASMSHQWISDEKAMEERVEVTDTGDARILFPFNSSNKIDSPEVEAYLNSLASRLVENEDEKVYIVGHTDSLGEPGANRRLSERRAKKIRDILKGKGVQNQQIVPSGRGEADPVAPNRGETSRQLNRRVEITIK